ncbi:hypothetical protein TRICHSKD4_3703 [Roseibium sp. TrichSKD4]|uniref:hypothetical protein n=1 Tax=Roseibium sp. TrichSKD4 TaxID=744980 RepID=UPI0001E56B54|nr:hypothetical protein [Roseibium sp. TrichSKD4]EFO30128.1 hypothetical protein TRICHSKD4_3703 [Roseibium sp. TrichSKD4]
MSEAENTQQNEPPKDAVVLVLMQKYNKARQSIASANGDASAILKKAGKLDINEGAFKQAAKLLSSDSDDKVQDFVDETTLTLGYLKAAGFDVRQKQASLLDLISTEPDRTPIDEKAFADGLKAGRLGEVDAANPHDLATSAGQKWIEGFARGRAERDLVLSMEAETSVIKGEHPESSNDNSESDGQDDFEDAMAEEGME